MTTDPGKQILVVDDEAELRELLCEYFGRHGLQTAAAATAEQARVRIAEQVPQVAVLDVHMPGEDGLSLTRWIRANHPQVGIVMLTTAAETVERVVGLEVGADDYVPKPFELRELLARIKGLQRRLTTNVGAVPVASRQQTNQQVRFGECLLELQEHRLIGPDGVDLAISASEFDLLELFARFPNRPLTRDQIMQEAHNRAWDVFDRSIDLRIMRLRRKIERNPEKPQVIKTVRNVGYVFVQQRSP